MYLRVVRHQEDGRSCRFLRQFQLLFFHRMTSRLRKPQHRARKCAADGVCPAGDASNKRADNRCPQVCSCSNI